MVPFFGCTRLAALTVDRLIYVMVQLPGGGAGEDDIIHSDSYDSGLCVTNIRDSYQVF